MTAVCRNDQPGAGCAGEFPNKTTDGLCLQCEARDAATTEEQRDKINSIPQCDECGAFGQHIKDHKCSGCMRKERQDATARLALQAQKAAVIARPGAHAVRSQPPNGQANSSSTSIIKRLPQARFITICIEAFSLGNLKAVGWLGSNSRAFADSTMFGDAIMELIRAFNASFETRAQVSLTRNDVIIRWHGNMSFHRDSDCGSVGEFYDTHFRLHNSETFLRMPPKFKATTQPAVALALFVDPVKFRENHNMDPPSLNDRATKIKRRISDSAEEPSSKRRAAGPSRPLTSSFNPTMSQVVAATPPFCIVNLEIIPLYLQSGKQIFPWKGEMKLTGVRLYDNPMAIGKDRTVYKMEVNGVAYVAKRCRHVPTDVQEFMDCEQQLQQSVLWLHRTSAWLDQFYNCADVLGCENDVHEGFEVQPAFVTAEDLANARPSVASGVAEEDMAAGEDNEGKPYSPKIIWVLQRCNGKTQDRLNLVKPQQLQPNKIDATLLAFAHFFWEKHVEGPEVLSHFQTSQGKMSNNQYGKLIFDVVAQDDQILNSTRFADDGSRGAHTVKEMHHCNRVCQLFGLKPDAANEEEDEEKDDEEET
ncbi:hypothetical protein C8R47DRAFT_77716 [Mycena vitilis]|nr:hypothetical protein C8R47DRAFT_77716 [Mycena vitilis]